MVSDTNPPPKVSQPILIYIQGTFMLIKEKNKHTASYKEIQCKSALNKIKNDKFSFGYSLNIYRGCLHSCPYCFARYTHWFLGYTQGEEFDSKIFVKTNIPQVLEKELSKPKWKRKLVSLGTATDPYQPIEKKFGLTRKCLELFAQYRTPIILSTKSSLINRDVDILKKISQNSFAAVAITLTTTNDDLRKIIEPRTSPIKERIKVLRALKESGVKTGIHLLPIMKYINDSESSISNIIRVAKEYDVDYFIYGGLNLAYKFVKESFFKTLYNVNKKIYNKYINEWESNSLYSKEYMNYINKMVSGLKKKYNLNTADIEDIIRRAYIDVNTQKDPSAQYQQLNLF